MRILKFPHPILFKKCEEVTVFGTELKVILDNMWDTMKTTNGIGLAANQVGLSNRMFVMEAPMGERVYLVNPKIIRKSVFTANLKEGCLSAPDEHLQIPDRAAWVKVSFQDENGTVNERVFKDIWSVCVQHEIQHLEGESFMQSKSLPSDIRKALAKKWKLKKKNVIF